MNLGIKKITPGTDPLKLNVTLLWEDNIPESGLVKSVKLKVDVPRNLVFDELFEVAKKEAIIILRRILDSITI